MAKHRFGPAAALLVLAAASAQGDTASLAPLKDNTLYESASGSLSNGAGEHFFAGRTGAGAIRRGLLAFDVASAVPAGSTIQSVKLTLNMSRTLGGEVPVTLHQVLANWGEGTSNATFEEGQGAAATLNDATWIHRFFNATLWSVAGGQFDAAPSASLMVEADGSYTWGSTPGLVADVQGWLDAPATNFGWLVKGDESASSTTKRFDSRNHPEPTVRPVLEIEYSVGGTGAGRVPDGDGLPGTPLTIDKDGTSLRLEWGASCNATDGDYAVYEGLLGDFTSHVPATCTTAGETKATIASDNEKSLYFLVVPQSASAEGSYGVDGAGAQRPASGTACAVQEIECP